MGRIRGKGPSISWLIRQNRVRNDGLATHNERDDPAAISAVGQMRFDLLALVVAADALQVIGQQFRFRAFI
jgi:hypothetical protein